LTSGQRNNLLEKLEFVDLPVRTLLNEAGGPIEFGYFVNSGLVSVLSVMQDGNSIEVGLIGSEGFAGLPLVVGLSTSPTRMLIQVAGSAFRIRVNDLKLAVRESEPLRTVLSRYSYELTMQATQVAACNRLHEVDERLARWLLMSQDRLGGDVVPLTQEFLAHMLGTRRASVTVAAGQLQKAGFISYTRGSVKIENRALLEESACECYTVLKHQVEVWRNE
jgi:CRP-like cAMP-binding protein